MADLLTAMAFVVIVFGPSVLASIRREQRRDYDD